MELVRRRDQARGRRGAPEVGNVALLTLAERRLGPGSGVGAAVDDLEHRGAEAAPDGGCSGREGYGPPHGP